jgi:hypothetical protein
MSDGRESSTGVFLYGVVPSDVEPTADAHGVGSSPGPVRAIRQDDLAALVSDVSLDEPIGRPDDLTAYQRLLDETVAVAPVVPVRFGTVMTAADGVEDWLTDQHGEIAEALDEVEGRVQYTVRGRFDEQAFIGAVLADDPAAAELADRVRKTQSQPDRIHLGEMIAHAVEARQQAESRELVAAVSEHAVASAPLPASHELDAVNVAWLVQTDEEEAFIQAVEDFAEKRRDLVHMRLLGPQAPYDFVAKQPPR